MGAMSQPSVSPTGPVRTAVVTGDFDDRAEQRVPGAAGTEGFRVHDSAGLDPVPLVLEGIGGQFGADRCGRPAQDGGPVHGHAPHMHLSQRAQQPGRAAVTAAQRPGHHRRRRIRAAPGILHGLGDRRGQHRMRGDLDEDPVSRGGQDAGPSPYDALLASLGACSAITLRMYAERKQLTIRSLSIDLSFHREAERGVIQRVVHLDADLTPEQRARFADIMQRCCQSEPHDVCIGEFDIHGECDGYSRHQQAVLERPFMIAAHVVKPRVNTVLLDPVDDLQSGVLGIRNEAPPDAGDRCQLGLS